MKAVLPELGYGYGYGLCLPTNGGVLMQLNGSYVSRNNQAFPSPMPAQNNYHYAMNGTNGPVNLEN